MRKIIAALTGLAAAAVPSMAFAHHPMGGATPNTFMDGFLSGIGHPIIGIDHLAFIVLVGLAAVFLTRKYMAPLVFVGGTLAGCLLIANGTVLPYAELIITGSVILLGALVMSGQKIPSAVYLAIFAIAGIFHGGAYGEAIIGAEATPLVSYLAGFAIIQYLIAIGAGLVVERMWRASDATATKPRIAGAVAAGIGVAFFVENVEGMLF
ncbi:HupE/UreJ family protein [uncultured Sneathiella sp.]|jgi:urease accessory protein|uniref:HupE/UreJ family protein n=1 Tax=uncultured Sneathiella sp. TaxID=879315 RepID=UPI0030DB62BB|tara:strand:+ start:1415 stop:2041 length:627 start_codon:yes stop_codon:yes gene_type:complete